MAARHVLSEGRRRHRDRVKIKIGLSRVHGTACPNSDDSPAGGTWTASIWGDGFFLRGKFLEFVTTESCIAYEL